MQTYRPTATVRAERWLPADAARTATILSTLLAAGVDFSHHGRGTDATLIIHQRQEGITVTAGAWILLHEDDTVSLEDAEDFPVRYALVSTEHRGVRNRTGAVAPGATVVQGRDIHMDRL
ncbi:hypothetical protein [Nocardiopsis synnemataformans]|uniref:hypothetical protein n=1 Tax=Nocardiopsis synnemataformans TaxID=61305 RepID=UPI003EBA2DA1